MHNLQAMILDYLSNFACRPFRTLEDVLKLSSRELLQLMEVVEDSVLEVMIHVFKSDDRGKEFFEKLMGNHEPENRELVETFFKRYQKQVLVENVTAQYNPLALYLPLATLDDLAFVQSRQTFFLRQSIQSINEYFLILFHEQTEFQPGEEEQAWNYFWEKITTHD